METSFLKLQPKHVNNRITLFFYEHKLYKHTQIEKVLEGKHMLSIIRAWEPVFMVFDASANIFPV